MNQSDTMFTAGTAAALHRRRDLLGLALSGSLTGLSATGPEKMKPVGETEFFNGLAAMSASAGRPQTTGRADSNRLQGG